MVGYYITTCEQNDIYREKKFDKYGKCYYFYINMPEHSEKKMIRSALFLKRTGLLNDNFSNLDSVVYNNKGSHYYLIKDYAQHAVIT